MSAVKHTPGPWHDTGDSAHVLGKACRAVRTNFANYPTVAYVPGYDDEQGDANARLISAAPDLLKALKHAVHWHDQLSREDIAIMEAAIAKAEGQP